MMSTITFASLKTVHPFYVSVDTLNEEIVVKVAQKVTRLFIEKVGGNKCRTRLDKCHIPGLILV